MVVGILYHINWSSRRYGSSLLTYLCTCTGDVAFLCFPGEWLDNNNNVDLYNVCCGCYYYDDDEEEEEKWGKEYWTNYYVVERGEL